MSDSEGKLKDFNNVEKEIHMKALCQMPYGIQQVKLFKVSITNGGIRINEGNIFKHRECLVTDDGKYNRKI